MGKSFYIFIISDMSKVLLFLFLFISGLCTAQQDTLHWHKLSPCPGDGRADFASFLIDSDFYMIGGFDSLGHFRRDVWCYHLGTDRWEQKGNLPGGAVSASVGFALKNHGYLLTGLDSLANYHCDSAFWKYDPNNDIWTRQPDFPGLRRYIASTFQYNNKGYVFGGLSSGSFSQYKEMWRYDPDSTNWNSDILSS